MVFDIRRIRIITCKWFFLKKQIGLQRMFFSTFDTTWMKNVDVSEEAEYHIQDALFTLSHECQTNEMTRSI